MWSVLPASSSPFRDEETQMERRLEAGPRSPVVDWYLTHVIWLLAFSQRHYRCLSGSLGLSSLTASYSMALPFAAEEQMPKFLRLNIHWSRHHGMQIKESAQGRLAAMAYPTGVWDK